MFADAMVADALLSLKRTDRQLRPPPLKQSSPAPPLDWSVRQRRSRHPARHQDVEMKKIRKTDGEPARASPTTPLSWSCAASVSGGSEESSKPPKPTGGSRSKVCRCCPFESFFSFGQSCRVVLCTMSLRCRFSWLSVGTVLHKCP